MKKLLVLGTSVGSVDIVQYARSIGIYTVVADNLPPEKSAAKRVADEAIMISTADVNALIEYAKANQITAAFAGVSEFNIENARKVNEALGVPFYYTPEQWNRFMNKGNFRQLCQNYSVMTPETYFIGSKKEYRLLNKESIVYPVIVKPVDNGANVGISICRNETDLDLALTIAFAESKTEKAIIERFIEGPEISSTYVVQNHRCKLVCFGLKFAYKNEKGLQALAHGYIYPSPNVKDYLEKASPAVEKMILMEGLNNCTIFFQGIYNNHDYYLFEAGLRMEGTATFRITEAMNGQNFMKFMVDNVLNIESNYNIEKEDATFSGKQCFIFSLIANEGTISRIEGTEQIAEENTIISFEQRHYIGTRIENDGTLRQILFRFAIKDESVSNVIETIKWIKKTIRVFDENGNDMLIREFDPAVMLKPF